jgi:hypothetical protein
MTFMVARHSPKYGLIEPLDAVFSAHDCTRGKEIGIQERYEDRAAAATDAARLERHVNEPGCIYLATRIASPASDRGAPCEARKRGPKASPD